MNRFPTSASLSRYVTGTALLAAGVACVIVAAKTLWRAVPLSDEIVPPGTVLFVRLAHPLDSRTARVGAAFEAQVVSTGVVGAKPGIPLGAQVEGRCVAVRAGGVDGRPGYLRLTLSGLVDSRGHSLPLETSTVSWWGTGTLELGGRSAGALLHGRDSGHDAEPEGYSAVARESADAVLTPDVVLTFILMKHAVVKGFTANP